MKLKQIVEADAETVTPKITWRQNGDKSWNVRIDYGNDRVYVHTNKNRDVLAKLVKERYGPKKFV